MGIGASAGRRATGRTSLPAARRRAEPGTKVGSLSGPPPGHAEYLGAGTVRLDEAAITSLAELPDGEDFRITFTDAGPILTVGAEHYAVREEHLDSKP